MAIRKVMKAGVSKAMIIKIENQHSGRTSSQSPQFLRAAAKAAVMKKMTIIQVRVAIVSLNTLIPAGDSSRKQQAADEFKPHPPQLTDRKLNQKKL